MRKMIFIFVILFSLSLLLSQFSLSAPAPATATAPAPAPATATAPAPATATANKSGDLNQGYYHKQMALIPKETRIVVVDFTKAYGGVFKGYAEEFDGEGYFHFRGEHLAKAMKLEARDVLRRAKTIKGTTIKIKEDLITVLAPPYEIIP